MDEQVKILCVDSESAVLKSLQALLSDQPVTVLIAASGEEGLELLAAEDAVRLVLSAYRMPEMNGVTFLGEVSSRWPDTLRMVLADFADTAPLVEEINAGRIHKFIPKPWDDAALQSAVLNALQHQDLKAQNSRLNQELQKKNQQMQEINDKLEQMVTRRTEALEIRNRVLQISQGILDVLPVVVFGIDPEQMIVTCNEFARDLFPYGGMGPLGSDRCSVFSPEVNELIDRLASERLPKATLVIHGKRYRGEVRRLHETLSQGVVLVLVPEV